MTEQNLLDHIASLKRNSLYHRYELIGKLHRKIFPYLLSKLKIIEIFCFPLILNLTNLQIYICISVATIYKICNYNYWKVQPNLMLGNEFPLNLNASDFVYIVTILESDLATNPSDPAHNLEKGVWERRLERRSRIVGISKFPFNYN